MTITFRPYLVGMTSPLFMDLPQGAVSTNNSLYNISYFAPYTVVQGQNMYARLPTSCMLVGDDNIEQDYFVVNKNPQQQR